MALSLAACEAAGREPWPSAVVQSVAIVCLAFCAWRILRGLFGGLP